MEKILNIPGIQQVLGKELEEAALATAETTVKAAGETAVETVVETAGEAAVKGLSWGARAASLGTTILETIAFEIGYRFGRWLFDKAKFKQAWDDWFFAHLPKGIQDIVAPNAPDSYSHDPNAAIGPGGFGPNGFIADDQQALPYTIDFENAPTATAPAQNVTVTDQLDPNLDWSTFAFTAAGFGDNMISVPSANGHFFQTIVPMTYNGETFDVQVQLSIDLGTGLVSATFQSLNPDTSLPPDALTGFLPPEDGTGRGMGFFSYLVSLKPGLSTGTQVRNVAVVTFDSNASITTDQVDDNDPTQGTDPTKEDLLTIDVVRRPVASSTCPRRKTPRVSS